MIRVFKSTDKTFDNNGDAVLIPLKANVVHKLNGDFYIEITCKSEFYPYLTQGNIIVSPTPQGDQAFRIDSTLERKGDRVTIKAYHVFYDAQNYVIADSYVVDMNCKNALNHLNNATDTPSPFTMDSDITSVNNLRCVRKSLYEAVNDVMGRWGGNLVVDNWRVNVKKQIGTDNGITIRYAKNLIELTAKYDFSGVCTKLLPVGKDGLLLPELFVYSPTQYDTPYTRVLSISQSLKVEDYPSKEAYQAALVEDLRQQAQASVNKSCIPVITYTLKGRPELVSDIGDIIQVVDERIGVNITTQVIGYEYDVITGQYNNLTFGNFGTSLSNLMSSVKSTASAVANDAVGDAKSEINADISGLYQLLQGSYVIYRGYDILICDKKPVENADNIIKFSNTGISITTEGINGDFVSVYDINTQALNVKSLTLDGENINETIESLLNQLKEINDKITIHKDVSIDQYNRLPATKTRDGIYYYITNRGYMIHNGVTYGKGGGTEVEANPADSPTANITTIKIGNTTYAISGGALNYWIETEEEIYNTYEIEGISTGVDGYLFNYVEWKTWAYNVGTIYYGTFYFRKKNNLPAIIGVGGYDNAQEFYIASTDPDAVKWQYNCPYVSTGWVDAVNGGTSGDTSRGAQEFTIEYEGVTWYISQGTSGVSGRSSKPENNFKGISGFSYGNAQANARRLLETCFAKPTTTCRAGIGIDTYVLYLYEGDNNIFYVDKEGVFNGTDFKINGVSIENRYIKVEQKGAANGVAELDNNGKVPSSQLPSYVDDVIEGYLYEGDFYTDAAHTDIITPETGKIYVDLTTEKTYRWGGTAYVVISESLALGETSSTAYRGDRGKVAYDHATDASRLTTATASGLYKVASTAEGHIADLTPVAKSDITGLGIPAQDTTYTAGTNMELSNGAFNCTLPLSVVNGELCITYEE